MVTDLSGNYAHAFYNLPAGAYAVMETNLPRYLDVSDIDGGDFNTITITLGAGSELNSTGNDFLDEPSRTVSGTVLEDTDNDGDGDVPIAIVAVALFDSSGFPIATTMTDSAGSFYFRGRPNWCVHGRCD